MSRAYDRAIVLVDCIAMTTMRRRGFREVLTNARLSLQEGFNSSPMIATLAASGWSNPQKASTKDSSELLGV